MAVSNIARPESDANVATGVRVGARRVINPLSLQPCLPFLCEQSSWFRGR